MCRPRGDLTPVGLPTPKVAKKWVTQTEFRPRVLYEHLLVKCHLSLSTFVSRGTEVNPDHVTNPISRVSITSQEGTRRVEVGGQYTSRNTRRVINQKVTFLSRFVRVYPLLTHSNRYLKILPVPSPSFP